MTASSPSDRRATRGDASDAVAPLDVDGVAALAAGTALWAVAFVALAPFHRTLDADGRLWWLTTCAVGFLLGLVGLAYVIRRRASRAPAVR